MAMDDGPPLLRPIPRRPFDLNLTSPTPPDEDSPPPSPGPPDFTNSRLLRDPRQDGMPSPLEGGGGASLSRAQSIINLTASTLFGIYSPTAWGRDGRGREDTMTGTPWGTGAQTPVKRGSIVDDDGDGDGSFELVKDRSRLARRRSSQGIESAPAPAGPPPPAAVVVLSLALRVALLFALGVGYGVLLTRWRRGGSSDAAAIILDGADWPYLALWGVYGVALGGLMPWFDGIWEANFGSGGGGSSGRRSEDTPARKRDVGSGGDRAKSSAEGDWVLVIRGIGAFVGIAFAIRKLPWTSTMQVSLTLALANPILWYLIDRSLPGFVLSSAVGVAGSAVIMGFNPSIMPSPTTLSSNVHHRNSSFSSSSPGGGGGPVVGFVANQETLELGIWMLSILFCSCLCFGNIGRRLALNSSASRRGRWGGER